MKRRFFKKGCFAVYILECTDGSYYTGYTNDLDARLKLHNSGKGAKYVRTRRPAQLVYKKEYRYYKYAVAEERRIKTLPRVKKVELVERYTCPSKKKKALVSFRKVISTRDAKSIERLARVIWCEHYTPIIGARQVKYMLDNFQSTCAVKEQIREGHQYFLIRLGRSLVGYFSVLARYKEKELFLSKLYVSSAFRGKGCGHAAVNFIVNKARKARLLGITLNVSKKNLTSISFYEQCGFVIISPIVKDIGGGFTMDDWLMLKQVGTNQ